MSIEYLNNKVFEELIFNFKKLQKVKSKNKLEFSKAEQELAEAFYILSDNIIRAFKFQLIERDDMLQEGVMICFEKIDCFDPNYVTESGYRSRAFNYYTTCILNHFRQLYRTAKNYKQLQERLFEFLCKQNQDRVFKLMMKIPRQNDEEIFDKY